MVEVRSAINTCMPGCTRVSNVFNQCSKTVAISQEVLTPADWNTLWLDSGWVWNTGFYPEVEARPLFDRVNKATGVRVSFVLFRFKKRAMMTIGVLLDKIIHLGTPPSLQTISHPLLRLFWCFIRSMHFLARTRELSRLDLLGIISRGPPYRVGETS